MSPTANRLSIARIAAAAATIDPVFLHTPQFVCEALGDALGSRLTLKVETVNPIRSFKGRGADHFVTTALARGERGPFVCASAGNFGQGMAYACRRRGLALVVFVAPDANPMKVERMRRLGAEVRTSAPGDDFDAAKDAARRYAAATGARFVEDGLDVEVAEGAGTIAVELLGDGPVVFDAVLVPLGDGALLGGMARWIKAHTPMTRVIGVCSQGAPAMHDAWHGDSPAVTRPATIADGIAVRTPIAAALADLRGQVDDVVLVSDDALVAAMRLVHTHAGLVAEPAGVAGLAAVLEAPSGTYAGKSIATVLCGGNVHPKGSLS